MQSHSGGAGKRAEGDCAIHDHTTHGCRRRSLEGNVGTGPSLALLSRRSRRRSCRNSERDDRASGEARMNLLSVIIPVFNGGKFLRAAVQSVLDLGYEPLELIIVDDGSTDGTAGIARALPAELQYLTQANRGPAGARNAGLRRARGDVIGFLDADDLWTPAIVTRALALLLSTPDLDVVHGRVQEIAGMESTNGTDGFSYASEPYPFINIGSAVYRKQVFAKICGFDETMLFCEDYDWFLRAFDGGVHKARIDDVTLLYRLHPGAMTTGKTIHEIGMARANKKAVERRRSGAARSATKESLPPIAEYIGMRPSRVSDFSAGRYIQVPRASAEHVSMRLDRDE